MSEPLLSCSLGPEDIQGLVAAYEQALIALGACCKEGVRDQTNGRSRSRQNLQYRGPS